MTIADAAPHSASLTPSADGARDIPKPVMPWAGVGSAQRWWLLIVLTLASILSFMDRSLLKLLVEPLKADLGVSDLQISVLVGLSFSALYSICCVPMGYVSDIVNRKKLIGGAVLVWSVMAATCGLAASYWQLFVGRAGLGIGEAALQPAAVSLIRDSFPPERRARAFSVFGLGPLVGSGMAMLLGGLLFAFADRGGTAGWPLIGHLKAWQFALVAPAVVGMLLALVVFTIHEPKREPVLAADRPTFGELGRHMKTDRLTYFLLFAAPTLWSLAGSGWNGWMAAGIGRTWHMSPGAIGAIGGPIALVCTPIGLITMGFLMDSLVRRGFKDATLQITLVAQALHMVPAMLIFLAPTKPLMWLAYGASMLFTGTIQVAANTLLAEATPGRLMGKTSAVFNMVQNFLGLAVGPTVYALVARGVFGGDTGLVPSMMLCYAVFISLSMALVVFLLVARRRGRAQVLAI